jgi:hypothetical protein
VDDLATFTAPPADPSLNESWLPGHGRSWKSEQALDANAELAVEDVRPVLSSIGSEVRGLLHRRSEQLSADAGGMARSLVSF